MNAELIRSVDDLLRRMNNQEAIEQPLFTTTSTANATPVALGTGALGPGWVDLASSVTGVLPVANGGTGLSTLTANGILYASSATVVAMSSTFVFQNSRLGIGVAVPGSTLHMSVTDAVTNALTTMTTIGHNSSGTPAVGFGSGVLFQLQSSTTVNRDAARLAAQWLVATDASRAGMGVLSAFYTTTERTCLQWAADSAAPLLGFFGAAAAAKPAIVGNNGGLPGLTSALTGLAVLGLITDSTTNSATIPAGTGTANQLTYWSGTNTITGSTNFYIDASNKILNIDNLASGTAAVSIGDVVNGNYLRLRHTSATQSTIDRFVAAGSVLLDFNPTPADGTSAASLRFFRSVTTTGTASLQIYIGDSTSTVNCQFAGNNNSYVCANNSRFGVGTGAPTTMLHTLLTDAATNTIVNVDTIGHSSSGTPAAGFGSGLLFALHSTTTVNRDAARMTVAWATATDASRASQGKLSAFYTTSERECIRWEANATVALVGFLGAAAVARQVVTGSRGANAALASALTSLANLGLITDSSTV